MSVDFKTSLLCDLLDCGYADIGIIEDCKYDFDEIIEECKENFGDISLAGLADTILSRGLCDIQDSIDKRIKNLEECEQHLNKTCQAELDALKEIDPFEDTTRYFNYLDTHIWLSSDNEELWKKYLVNEVDEFEENTGFAMQGAW